MACLELRRYPCRLLDFLGDYVTPSDGMWFALDALDGLPSQVEANERSSKSGLWPVNDTSTERGGPSLLGLLRRPVLVALAVFLLMHTFGSNQHHGRSSRCDIIAPYDLMLFWHNWVILTIHPTGKSRTTQSCVIGTAASKYVS